MTPLIASKVSFRRSAAALLATLGFAVSGAAQAPALLDDFSAADRTTAGTPRVVVDDRDIGGKSKATVEPDGQTLKVSGELVPARGMPGWISVVLPIAADGAPQDLSHFKGVRLRLKVTRGNLSVQAASADVDNFDYHVSTPISRKPDEFQEVKIAFADLKRGWSEQTALNLKAITSINLVAAGMAPDKFAYEIDEIGFY